MKKNNWKAYLLRSIFILSIGLAVGIAAESLYELNTCRRAQKGGHEISSEEILEKNITRIDNEEVNEEGVETKTIHVQIPERYINKLRYSYKSEETFTPDIQIHTKNIYDNPEIRTIKDICRYNLDESIVNIKDYVTEIKITVPTDVKIGKIVVDNTWDFNWYRVVYISVFVALILFVISFRGLLARKIEYGFAVISLSCGLLFIAIQPPECGSWDEHVHFAKTFDFFEHGIADRSVAEEYVYINQEHPDRAAFLSKEEKEMQIQYLNANADTVSSTYARDAITLNAVGEVHMAIAVKLAKYLGMSFYGQYLVGKIANLFLYTLLMFLAIRVAPIGKKFLTTVALMPTLMLQSVSYTYDIVVIAFLVLGFALVMEDFVIKERKLTWKRMLLIISVFVIGSCPKPVYIFLLALFLVFPKEKFMSPNRAMLYKGIIIMVCMVMIMTMILPAAGGHVEGDARGGATDVKEQLALVLKKPFAYIQVFFRNFTETFDAYFFGSNSLGFMAFAGLHPFHSFIGVFCVGIALTEKKKKIMMPAKNIWIFKGMLLILIFGVIGLIWSALYIKFTPVGQTTIAGVQPRYYIPLLYPIFALLYSDKIEGKWSEKTYNMIMFLIILWITHGAIYQQFFVTYCR